MRTRYLSLDPACQPLTFSRQSRKELIFLAARLHFPPYERNQRLLAGWKQFAARRPHGTLDVFVQQPQNGIVIQLLDIEGSSDHWCLCLARWGQLYGHILPVIELDGSLVPLELEVSCPSAIRDLRRGSSVLELLLAAAHRMSTTVGGPRRPDSRPGRRQRECVVQLPACRPSFRFRPGPLRRTSSAGTRAALSPSHAPLRPVPKPPMLRHTSAECPRQGEAPSSVQWACFSAIPPSR